MTLLRARVTHLEMTAPPARRQPMPTRPRLALLRAMRMPLSFYRYLYAEIGRPHHWQARRRLSDDDLAAIIHDEAVEIHVLYADGAPAGFFEISLHGLPEVAEIVHFGLIPERQRMGLSPFLLSEAIFAAFAGKPRRVILQTNSLDSPRALSLYQRAGFVPYAYEDVEIEAWDD